MVRLQENLNIIIFFIILIALLFLQILIKESKIIGNWTFEKYPQPKVFANQLVDDLQEQLAKLNFSSSSFSSKNSNNNFYQTCSSILHKGYWKLNPEYYDIVFQDPNDIYVRAHRERLRVQLENEKKDKPPEPFRFKKQDWRRVLDPLHSVRK